MGKLHEILAVEKDLAEGAKKLVAEGIKTFSSKANLFIGTVTTLRHFDESNKRLDSETEVTLSETVPGKLSHINRAVQKYWDTIYIKENTNTVAKADLEHNGTILVRDVPATVLLGLESRLSGYRELLESIPTLSPGQKWELDPDYGENVYRSQNPDNSFKTEKNFEFRIMTAATDKHPAQIEKWNVDKPVADIQKTTWSGMISSARKAQILANLDSLISSVKKARQRANSVEIVKGQPFTDILMKEIFAE